MSVYPELDGLSPDDLIQCFHGPPLDGKTYATVYFEEVAARIRKQGDDGLRFLLEQVSSVEDDEPRLQAVMLGLTFPRWEDPWVERFLLAHLADRRPLVVMDAIDNLSAPRGLAAHDRVLALAKHRSPYVRGAVLRYLAALFPDEARPLLLVGLSDRHFIVRDTTFS